MDIYIGEDGISLLSEMQSIALTAKAKPVVFFFQGLACHKIKGHQIPQKLT